MRTSSVSRRRGRSRVNVCFSTLRRVCPFRFLRACLWRLTKDQRLKVATADLHPMNIWLKHCLSTFLKASCASKLPPTTWRAGGEGGSKTADAALAALLLCFIAPLHTPYRLRLCSFTAVCVCERFHSTGGKTPFMFSLIAVSAFVSHFAGFVFIKECFAIVTAAITFICVYNTVIIREKQTDRKKCKKSSIFSDIHYTLMEPGQLSLLALRLLVSSPHPPPSSASVWH